MNCVVWDLQLNKSGIKQNKQTNKNQPCLLYSTKISERSNTSEKGPRRHCQGDVMPGSPPSVFLPRTSFPGSRSSGFCFCTKPRGQGAGDFKPSICFHGDMTASPRPSSVSFLNSRCTYTHTCTHLSPRTRTQALPTALPRPRGTNPL